MDWILLLLVLAALYGIIALYIYKKNLWEDHIIFYGPIMAIRCRRVGVFDRFTRIRTFLRMYGTLGAVIVVLVSVAMVGMLLFSLQYNIVEQPPPTAVNELRNVLAIPGVNQFIPFTFAVWFAFVLTLIIHEFGHAILSRVENIRVKFIGILFLVIPIGAFVEPDEEDFEKTKGVAKIRMLGAGITNNIVVGLICFGLLFFLLGMAVPVQLPLIKSIYKDYPAATAGIPPDSIIRSVNGIEVTTRDQVSTVLNNTKPGDTVTLEIEKDQKRSIYALTLSRWPESPGAQTRTSGFMGVAYYDAPAVKGVFDRIGNPWGILFIMAIPIEIIINPLQWQHFIILINDTTDLVSWNVPFPQYWFFVQILFWCAWFNIGVGLCNALPMVPLDGGYILKEGVDRLMERGGLSKYASHVVSAVSFLVLFVLVTVFTLPLLLHS
jgi:membrane-associated protease RseP (regulator of RpoE activity)